MPTWVYRNFQLNVRTAFFFHLLQSFRSFFHFPLNIIQTIWFYENLIQIKLLSILIILIHCFQLQINSQVQMIVQVQKQNRIRALSSLSISEHGILSLRQKNKSSHAVCRMASDKKMAGHEQKAIGLNVKDHRSQTVGSFRVAFKNPYQKLVKELNLVLPTPKQKFYEFMDISQFNRVGHHIQLIQHFLKQYKFFGNHPVEILHQMAKKVLISNQTQLEDKFLLVIERGQCVYNKELYLRGEVVGRKQLRSCQISCSPETKFITLVRHEYDLLVASYLEKQKKIFRNFLLGIQVFKMFSKKACDKFMQSLSLYFFCEEQDLYRFGQEANELFIVFKGKAVRRVIVQIDKTNKIPLFKYQKIIKILSKSYQHKIGFQNQDLIGVAQVIDHIQTRKQNIKFQQNSVVLGLDKNVFQQNLDEYIIDRLRKYNSKKYPVTYDKLCQKYEKQKSSIRQQELRKIQALKGTITNTTTQKKAQKIHNIISKYQQNIKNSEIMNLLQCKIQQRRVQRQ